MDRTGAQTMLYLTCTMISSVDLAHDGVSCAKEWYLWIVVQFTLMPKRLKIGLKLSLVNKDHSQLDF